MDGLGWSQGEIVGQHTTGDVFSLPFKGRAGVGMGKIATLS
jgi:hypothetical protein